MSSFAVLCGCGWDFNLRSGGFEIKSRVAWRCVFNVFIAEWRLGCIHDELVSYPNAQFTSILFYIICREERDVRKSLEPTSKLTLSAPVKTLVVRSQLRHQ